MVWRRDAEALTWRSVVDFELREFNSPWQDFSFFRWRRVTSFGHRDDRQWGVGRKCHLTRNQLRASRYPIPAKNISFSLQHQNLLLGRLCFWSFDLPSIRGVIRILILFMGACQQVNWTIREKIIIVIIVIKLEFSTHRWRRLWNRNEDALWEGNYSHRSIV